MTYWRPLGWESLAYAHKYVAYNLEKSKFFYCFKTFPTVCSVKNLDIWMNIVGVCLKNTKLQVCFKTVYFKLHIWGDYNSKITPFNNASENLSSCATATPHQLLHVTLGYYYIFPVVNSRRQLPFRCSPSAMTSQLPL